MFEHCPDRVITERVTIRRFESDDLPHVHALHSIDAVNQYLPYQTWTHEQDAHDWQQRTQGLRESQSAEQYVLRLNDADQFIGTCIVFKFEPAPASVMFGYVLHPDFWGRGLMLEAMQGFTEALVNALQLEKIGATVEAPNVASQALLQKLGFSMVNESVDEPGIKLGHWERRYP